MIRLTVFLAEDAALMKLRMMFRLASTMNRL
jgi:hypothetical protein